MSRTPNFKNDNEIAKIGENLFVKYAEYHGYMNVKDVREVVEFQDNDIDYVVLTGDFTEYDILKMNKNRHNLITNKFEPMVTPERAKTIGYSVEVKTDLVTHRTRNVVYELLSHDMPGCMAKSVADYIFYVAIDEATHVIQEAWIIKLKSWREWVRIKDRTINNGGPIKTNNFDKHGKNQECFNFLCNVDDMVKDNIAKKVNIERLCL